MAQKYVEMHKDYNDNFNSSNEMEYYIISQKWLDAWKTFVGLLRALAPSPSEITNENDFSQSSEASSNKPIVLGEESVN